MRLMMVMLTVVLIASHMSVDGLSTASDRGMCALFINYNYHHTSDVNARAHGVCLMVRCVCMCVCVCFISMY